ncbi:AraC family transcriptional regulator [Paenibacillus sp. IB182496]|uniref:AraC family transcriptional regulator n=1 Tax=Paenibacillus sabuli TaxID=2772509 RepID=A0A927BRS8_9BACL|nr:AraC family transcriptional regulator [Paenibacillus sabuli]MBD2845591.1 AraC family transcriptional regulator [Paenibacillus sabuli]
MTDFSLFPVMTDFERRLPLYLTSLGGWTHQPDMDRPGGYPDYQWLQVTSGTGVLRVGQRELTVGPSQGMLLMPGEAHAYHAIEAPWGVRWATFNGPRAAEMLRDLQLARTQALYLGNPDVALKHLQEMGSQLQAPHPTTALETSAALYRLLLDLYRYGSPTELRSRKQQMDALAPVLAHLETHYSRAITLPELAGLLGVSPQHICVLFQQALGVRPIEYLTRIRIRKAKELLLREPDAEVKRVAASVGYEHPSYFIKRFKQLEGVTPVLFRRIHRNRM